VLDQQHAFPEQINKTLFVTQFSDGLLERRDALAADSKDMEKAIPEGFGFGILRGLVFPFLGESERAAFDFIPAERRSDLTGSCVAG